MNMPQWLPNTIVSCACTYG